jgi:thiol-disulfide isomerase/thioredoxin
MTDRKRIKTSRYLAAFALTVIVFLIGYMIGTGISDRKLNNLAYLEQDIRVNSLSNELVFLLVQKDLCSSINTTSYTEDLGKIGKRLTYLESLYGYNAPEVISLKNYYSLLEIRHWMLHEEVNAKCGYDTPLVLYFYTNENCVDCEDQGLVLTNVHRNYPFFNTYSFEYNLENPALDYLKKKYEINQTRLPAIVVDGQVYYGFQSKEFIIARLKLEQKLAQSKIEHPEWYS